MEYTDTLSTWRKTFIIIIIMFCLFQFFASCQASIQNFSKHYSKLKHFKGGDYYYYNCHKIIQKTSFLIFWLHKKISITLKYSGDILRIFLEQKFVECSSNILVTLLCDYWILAKDRHLLLSNHTLLTQKQISNECWKHCNAEETLSEYYWNIACRLG